MDARTLPQTAPTRGAVYGWSSVLLDPGDVHRAEFLLQFLDLVADAGGHLELEIAGGAEHLVVEVLDERGQFSPGHAGTGRLRCRGPAPAAGLRDGCLA